MSLATMFAAASCSGGAVSDGPTAGSAGIGVGPGVAGSLSSASGSGSGGGSPGFGGASAVAGNSSSAAGSNASSGTGSGGSPQGMGGSGNNPPCTNNQHPDHMDKECSIWPEWDAGKPANEANCNAPWLTGAGYCLESCGKCSSGGGSAGSGNNTGGSGNNTGGSGSGGTGLGPGPTMPDITSGPEYHASRYWDCCKTHCATNAGAKSCGQDGVSQNNGTSSCQNGSAYACYSEAPRAIGDNVSYGYIAKPSPNCGQCYHIQFTGQGHYSATDAGSQLIRGKHMIVKVSNTGSDVNQDQFDLMIPGGGVGQFTQGCKNQWGNSIDLGATYGGFYNQDPKQKLMCNTGTHAQRKACVKQLCSQLPAGDARDGCNWWVDWLQLADNPRFRFKEIACPNDI